MNVEKEQAVMTAMRDMFSYTQDAICRGITVQPTIFAIKANKRPGKDEVNILVHDGRMSPDAFIQCGKEIAVKQNCDSLALLAVAKVAGVLTKDGQELPDGAHTELGTVGGQMLMMTIYHKEFPPVFISAMFDEKSGQVSFSEASEVNPTCEVEATHAMEGRPESSGNIVQQLAFDCGQTIPRGMMN